MKKVLFIILAISSSLFSCCTDESINQNSKLVQVIRGGCADGLPPDGIIQFEKMDTVYHYIKDNHLYLFVGFNATCCIYYEYQTEVHYDEIEIELEEASNDPCDCICWYEFTFEFKDMEKKLYNYVIKVEDYITFTGTVDLRN